MSFYLSLFVFILSFIAGLVLMVAGKDMKREKFLLLAAGHAMFLFAFIASLLLRNKDSVDVYNYFFMAFVCSGLILSGLSWRSHSPMPLRIYFSAFALTIPLFFFSPSMLLNFLLTMNYRATNGPVFHLEEEYYIEQQNTTRDSVDVPHYKVILKRGIFRQTIQRDINFGGKLDSLRVLEYNKGKEFKVRGYTSKVTYVSSDVDSLDATITLIKEGPGSVEYHL